MKSSGGCVLSVPIQDTHLSMTHFPLGNALTCVDSQKVQMSLFTIRAEVQVEFSC